MIGQIVSHYRILAKLGEGGMGVVYRAEDTRLGRHVVLKFLAPYLIWDLRAKERFINEAKAASALDHPNICTIHEIDETDEGQLFICMAYYEGETLREKIDGRKLPVPNVVDIAVQIAQGLECAQEVGIVHRDIKPANLILTKRGDVKIVDFGLAKLAGQSHLAHNGTSLGTVAYMSPEQAQELQEVDHRTDIWSLGVVLYEMLTGQPPFRGEYDQMVLYAIVNREPEPIRKLRPEVPPGLERITNKAMQKDPTDRYQKMSDLLSDLTLVGARSVKVSLEAVKNIPSIAVLPLMDISPQKDQEYFCDGLTEELINALAKIGGWRVVSRTSAFVFKGKELDVHTIGRQLSVSHILEGSVRKTKRRLRIAVQLIRVEDNSQLWSEKYDRMPGDVLAIQDDIARMIARKLKIKRVEKLERPFIKRHTINLEAYNLYLRARFHFNRRTDGGLKKGVVFCEQAITIDPAFAKAYAGLADCLILLGFQGMLPPQEVMPKAKIALEKALAIDDTLAEVHTSLGCIKSVYDRNWTDSVREFKRALALNPNYATVHHWYAIWYLLPMGEFDKCLAEFRKAQELDPLSLILNTSIGWQFYFARQFDLALEELKKTLEMDETFAIAHDILGQVYEQKRMYEEAIVELQKAVKLSGRRTISLASLGYAYALAGRREDAKKILYELRGQTKQKYVSSYHIALIYKGLGKKDQAFRWLEKAYEERNGWLNFLNVEPSFDDLRPDPRFTALLKKVGLQK